jgi:hypothetical protein
MGEGSQAGHPSEDEERFSEKTSIEDPCSPASGVSASLQQARRESPKCKEVDYCNSLAAHFQT